jgi:hypothetical protein
LDCVQALSALGKDRLGSRSSRRDTRMRFEVSRGYRQDPVGRYRKNPVAVKVQCLKSTQPDWPRGSSASAVSCAKRDSAPA